jgi:hypothetical protein
LCKSVYILVKKIVDNIRNIIDKTVILDTITLSKRQSTICPVQVKKCARTIYQDIRRLAETVLYTAELFNRISDNHLYI